MESEDEDREREKKSSHLPSVLSMPRTVLSNLHAIVLSVSPCNNPIKKALLLFSFYRWAIQSG